MFINAGFIWQRFLQGKSINGRRHHYLNVRKQGLSELTEISDSFMNGAYGVPRKLSQIAQLCEKFEIPYESFERLGGNKGYLTMISGVDDIVSYFTLSQ